MLAKYLRDLSFTCLVDMGCGTGQIIIELARLKPQARFIGIDRDEIALRKARRDATDSGLATRVDFVCDDCLHTSLAGRSADVITLRALLHHIQDISHAFTEISRLLTDGGVLVLQDGRRMPDAFFAEMNEELSRGGFPEEVHPGFDVEELSEELNLHGFTIEKILDVGVATFATPPYTSKVYSTGSFLLIARKSSSPPFPG